MSTAAIQWSHPLHQAASEGDRESLKQLLQDGHDPRVRGGASSWVRGAYDFLCRTPLHFAAKGGNVSCVRLLLAFGADPNSRDGDGYTPLHYTCQIQNPSPTRHKDIGECVGSLIDFGADMRSTTNFGQTPRELAKVHSNDVCKRELEKHGREVPSLLSLSRNVVSSLLRSSSGQLDSVSELRIPSSLKGYLQYSEVVSGWVASENNR